MSLYTWGVAVGSLLAVTLSGHLDGHSHERAGAGPVEIRCQQANVVVRGADGEDALLACAGAHDAAAFLAGQGFAVTAEVSIDIEHTLPPVVDASAAGCYLPNENRVVVLAYADLARRDAWFGMTMEPALYRSFVAHEVAHAFAAANFEIAQPAIQAHEYIAYVTMLATMAPDLRARLLARYPGERFDDDVQINATVYLFDPQRFGVRAYRHFLRRASGRDYLRAVVTGSALVE